MSKILLLLALLIIWVLPDVGRGPVGLLSKLFFTYLVVLILWPNYLALQLPGLPWISFRRLVMFPMALILLILVAFGRVMWQLDAKNLWWDESLSLQRAESNWLDLILGRLYLYDGLTSDLTHDQHPFFFFIVQGILVRLAGESETVLRFPSVMAVTKPTTLPDSSSIAKTMRSLPARSRWCISGVGG